MVFLAGEVVDQVAGVVPGHPAAGLHLLLLHCDVRACQPHTLDLHLLLLQHGAHHCRLHTLDLQLLCCSHQFQ